jgi:hypothetical protein
MENSKIRKESRLIFLSFCVIECRLCSSACPFNWQYPMSQIDGLSTQSHFRPSVASIAFHQALHYLCTHSIRNIQTKQILHSSIKVSMWDQCLCSIKGRIKIRIMHKICQSQKDRSPHNLQSQKEFLKT